MFYLDILSIGALAEVEEALRELIATRTGYIVEFTDKTVLTQYAYATPEKKVEIADMLLSQTRADAIEKGFDQEA